MGLWIRYKVYKFVQPKQISLDEFNSLINDYDGFIEKAISDDKELFIKNYKLKILLGPIILAFFLLTFEKMMELDKAWIVSIYIILSIIGIKCLGYIFTSLSIFDQIQNKKRFYKRIKELIEHSTDYDDFKMQMATWDKNQDLGLSGRIILKILNAFSRKR